MRNHGVNLLIKGLFSALFTHGIKFKSGYKSARDHDVKRQTAVRIMRPYEYLYDPFTNTDLSSYDGIVVIRGDFWAWLSCDRYVMAGTAAATIIPATTEAIK